MADDAKKQRTIKRRVFNRIQKTLSSYIDDQVDVELVESIFTEFRQAWVDLQSHHDGYVELLIGHDAATSETDSVVNEAESYIEEAGKEFRTLEREKFKYVRSQKIDGVKKETAEAQAWKSDCNKEAKIRQLKGLTSVRDLEENAFKCHESCIITMLSKQAGLIELSEAQDELKVCFQRLKDANRKLVLEKDDSSEELSWETTMCERYKHSISNIIKKRELLEANIISAKSHSSSTLDRVKMEPVRMPIFEGDIRSYPRFKSDFEKQVLPQIGNISSVAYVLTSCLRGKALDVVRNVDDDVDEIWNRLDDAFGRVSVLTDVVMNDIRRIQPVNEDDDQRLLELVDIVERGFRDLKRVKMEGEISNTTTVSIVEEKLPKTVKREWARAVSKCGSDIDGPNKFPRLLEFLLEQKRIIEYESAELRASGSTSAGSMHHVGGERTLNSGCLLHDTDKHVTENCRGYLAMTPEERFQLLRDKRACWTCLRRGHRSADCWSKQVCIKEGCDKYHHPTLHKEGNVSHGMVVGSSGILLIMEIPTMTQVSVNVLWDTGATLSLITFRKASELKLRGKKTTLSIRKVGGVVETIPSFEYVLKLKDKNGDAHAITVNGIEEISGRVSAINSKSVLHLFPNACEREVKRPHGFVDVLVGFEYAALHPTKQQSNGNLLLMKNVFGSCVGGSHPLLKEGTQCDTQIVSIVHNACIVKLDDFFEAEGMGIECSPRCGGCKCGHCAPGSQNFTLREEKELKQIEDGLEFFGDHWKAEYPWIRSPQDLYNNRVAAEGMLKSTERRLLKESARAVEYQNQINDMIKRGVARKLSNVEMNNWNGPIHYLSHHEVLKPDSDSTPCRIVFNASAKFRGKALNDFWAKGPDLLNNQLGILIRFRENEVAIAGDIKKMYHSIKLKPGVDEHVHRFLWRDLNTLKPPDTYVLTSVSFGDRPAGAIAATALRKTAEMGRNTYPEAADMIRQSSYVDDIIDSVKTRTKALQITADAEVLLEPGGFEFKRWVMSGSENQGMTTEKKIQVNIGQQQLGDAAKGDQKVLGTKWNVEKDVLEFETKLNFSRRRRKIRSGPDIRLVDLPDAIPIALTKREILSQINGIYDPLGLLTPFTVRAKIGMRKLWTKEGKAIDWDEPIPDVLRREWVEFFEELFDLRHIYFKRCTKPSNAVGDPTLVGFGDASEEAFGGVVYVVWHLDNGSFEARLVAAKGRIAPMKTITMPRLELNGAVLVKRLVKIVKEESRYVFEK